MGSCNDLDACRREGSRQLREAYVPVGSEDNILLTVGLKYDVVIIFEACDGEIILFFIYQLFYL